MKESQLRKETVIQSPKARTVDMRFEFIVLPVSDVDCAKSFYAGLGWKLDMDFVRGDDFRVIQFTPPGSPASIIFGQGITSAKPGSAQHLYLVVSDIDTARSELLARGASVGEPFHDAGGVFHHAGTEGRVDGPAPARRSYGSFAEFSDPDGNGWLLQEVTVRLPGHGNEGDTTFSAAVELASALRRARDAHGKLDKQIGLEEPDWLDWYAEYIVAEQAGTPLPT
ncbi:VOC family protein [Variovorax saccharolyticus]|uniref:VOC family protein n=1 Tax=Variovorax saccharolyticus TaxID=3053516 RepID=UPI0025791C46|nr:VOC family protein [Variovorax sp. J22R187]MDM0022247.1 glyoxalase [Variovorax sp. J22R187]